MMRPPARTVVFWCAAGIVLGAMPVGAQHGAKPEAAHAPAKAEAHPPATAEAAPAPAKAEAAAPAAKTPKPARPVDAQTAVDQVIKKLEEHLAAEQKSRSARPAAAARPAAKPAPPAWKRLQVNWRLVLTWPDDLRPDAPQ